MPQIEYEPRNFREDTFDIIDRANRICREYRAQGYSLTLRQVYYQFVARGWLRNKDTEYNRLGSILNDARLAGQLDWSYMEDRTRNLRENAHWTTVKDIVAACASQFRYDLWAEQPCRPEVWIEKDALVGVIEPICRQFDVPFFSCRGYVSQSEMWAAAMRHIGYVRNYQSPVILHFGDHDPSGVNMTLDIRTRLRNFVRHHVEGYRMLRGETVEDAGAMRPLAERWRAGDESRPVGAVVRLALSMAQIRTYNPPPNPAKMTDSRARDYVAVYGSESWELDALEPSVINALIRDALTGLRDDHAWERSLDRQLVARGKLLALAEEVAGERVPVLPRWDGTLHDLDADDGDDATEDDDDA